MTVIRWTGWGILSMLAVFVAPVVGWIAGWPENGVLLLVELGVLYLVALVAVAGLGLALNSERGPGGRVWTNGHTFDGIPMQRPAVAILGTLALLSFAGAAGQGTGRAVVFFALLAAGIGAAAGVPQLLRARLRPAVIASRDPLAGQGWKTWDVDPELPKRWQTMWNLRNRPDPIRDPQSPSPYLGPAYGVVSGKRAGLPITIFDAVEVDGNYLSSRATTTWVVHFPFALPATTVTVARDGTAIVAAPDGPRFGREATTPQFVAALTALGFRRWRFEGWDLACARPAAGDPPGTLVAVAEGLVAAIALIPSDVLTRHRRDLLPGATWDTQHLLEASGALPRIPRRPPGEADR